MEKKVIFSKDAIGIPTLTIEGKHFSIVSLSYIWTTATNKSRGRENLNVQGYFEDDLEGDNIRTEPRSLRIDLTRDSWREMGSRPKHVL